MDIHSDHVHSDIMPKQCLKHDGTSYLMCREKNQLYWRVFKAKGGETVFRGADEEACKAYLKGDPCTDIRG